MKKVKLILQGEIIINPSFGWKEDELLDWQKEIHKKYDVKRRTNKRTGSSKIRQ